MQTLSIATSQSLLVTRSHSKIIQNYNKKDLKLNKLEVFLFPPRIPLLSRRG
jgi:hypothetical protein